MTSNFTYPVPETSCPHIGFKDDLQTTLSYPSIRNYCHLCHPTVVPNFSHQREFCLASRYGECPVFLAKEITPMPEELLYHDHKHLDKQKNAITRILLIIVLLLFLLFVALTLETRASGKSSVHGSRPAEESSLIAEDQTGTGIERVPMRSVIQESIGPIRNETPVLLPSLEKF